MTGQGSSHKKKKPKSGHQSRTTPDLNGEGTPKGADHFSKPAHPTRRMGAKARARASPGGGAPSPEGALARWSPPPGQAVPLGTLTAAYLDNNMQMPRIPYEGPRQCLQMWKDLGADRVLLSAIAFGARAPLRDIPKQSRSPRPPKESMTTTIGEYLETGVMNKLTPSQVERRSTGYQYSQDPKKQATRFDSSQI